jgi:flagellar biosynthesis/type III secretory pathway M-ring protein FliF/YscJ
MDPTTSKSEPSPEAMERGYDSQPARGRAMVWFVVSFAIVMFAILCAIKPVMRHFTRAARQLDAPQSAVRDQIITPAGSAELQPSEPHDTLPREDLAAMHEQEDDVFERLGWLDDKRNVVSVPDAVIAEVQARSKQATTQRAPGAATQGGAR